MHVCEHLNKLRSDSVGSSTDRSSVGLELSVHLDTWVVDLGDRGQVLVLCLLIHVCNEFLLLSSQRKQLAFLRRSEAFEFCSSLVNFLGEDWQNWIVDVLHFTSANSDQG